MPESDLVMAQQLRRQAALTLHLTLALTLTLAIALTLAPTLTLTLTPALTPALTPTLSKAVRTPGRPAALGKLRVSTMPGEMELTWIGLGLG